MYIILFITIGELFMKYCPYFLFFQFKEKPSKTNKLLYDKLNKS